MGCCGSSEENAAETELAPPEWGKPMQCRLKKQGMFDADYNVYSVCPGCPDQKWMLIDAVGSYWDDGYTYFLKHRAPGQVDAEGKAASTTLGAVNIKGDWDAFSFRVSGSGRNIDVGPFYDMWDGDFDWGVSSEKKIWAVWTFSKRAVLYSNYEMTEQIGWLDITGSGAHGPTASPPPSHPLAPSPRPSPGLSRSPPQPPPRVATHDTARHVVPGEGGACRVRHRRRRQPHDPARGGVAQSLPHAGLPVQAQRVQHSDADRL